jgi:hypothetical protein
MRGIRNWALGLIATLLLVAASYQWLDRPIALYVHTHFQHTRLFERLTLIPVVLIPPAAVFLVALIVLALRRRPLSRFQSVFLVSAASLAAADLVKGELKFAFGRTWPETWGHNNLSFIGNGVYGFFPFHGNPNYASFPSGHMTAICTVLTVFWICYPRFRALYASGMAAAAIGLVGANFHFLGDVIAGAFLGISVGWFGVALWEMATHRVRPGEGAGGIR